MPQIERWFRARKSLHRRRVYYEDVFGHKNPEEELEGVHIIDSESDSEADISSPKAKCQVHNKTGATQHNNINSRETGNDRAMDKDNNHETATSAIDAVIMIEDDDSDVDEQFIADLQRHGMFARNMILENR